MRAKRFIGPASAGLHDSFDRNRTEPSQLKWTSRLARARSTGQKSSARSGSNVELHFTQVLPTTNRVEPEHFEIFNDDQPAVSQSGILGPAGGQIIAESPVLLHGPDAFKIFRDVVLSPSGTNKDNNEPAVANSGDYVFYTGNKYAARSTDGGQTWS